MARITASVYTSHVPAIGTTSTLASRKNPTGSRSSRAIVSKQWMREHKPDVIFLVYNDHATAFSLDMIPTFAIGTAAENQPANRRAGSQAGAEGHGPRRALRRIAQSVIQQDFDLTIVNKMDVDHGLTVPLSLMCGQPQAWPCPVIPFAVNVVQYPVPSGQRCLNLGKAIRKAIESYDEDLNVQIWGTGGMSRRVRGAAHGLDQQGASTMLLDRVYADPQGQAAVPHIDYVREAGSEGIELVMWLIARGAMADLAGGPAPKVAHRFYHVPASNTAVGHLILEGRIMSKNTLKVALAGAGCWASAPGRHQADQRRGSRFARQP